MSESKFTPAPWSFGRAATERFEDWTIDAPGSHQAWVIVGPESRDEAPVALVTSKLWDDQQHDANARLIAAAPELYEALDRVTHHLAEMFRLHPDDQTADTEAALYCARKALLKATPEQSEGCGSPQAKAGKGSE